MNTPEMHSIADSLAGKHIFITGITGFLGKAVLEKLLRDVPSIASIKVLVRGNRRFPTGLDRFQDEVLHSSIFDVLRQQHGERFYPWLDSKVDVIDGELTDAFFGLNHDAFSKLAQGVDLIINSAASVNFREAIDQALNINTLCLNNIIALAKAGTSPSGKPCITPVVQVSTCYVNGLNQGLMKEQVHPPATGHMTALDEDTYDIAAVMSCLQEKIASVYEKYPNKEEREQKLIRLGIQQSQYYGWNDTYTFTKWLGEQLLMQAMEKQNLAILRPSIIESTVNSPVPGWVEGVKVADAMIYAYAKGRVSVFPGDDSGVLDVIPVDLVANAVIQSSAHVLNAPSEYRIYQCCSGRLNPVKLKDFIDYLQEESKQNFLQYPKLFSGRPTNRFQTVSRQRFGLYMKALKAATWMRTISGRILGSNKAVRLMKKVTTTTELAVIFGFYSAPKYCYDSTQLEALQASFTVSDQKRFNAMANCFEWKSYLQDIHMPGLHKYALADKPVLNLSEDAHNDEVQKAA